MASEPSRPEITAFYHSTWVVVRLQPPKFIQLTTYADSVKTDVPNFVSLVDDGLSAVRSPSFHSTVPSDQNAEPSASAAPLTELDLLLLQSTQIDLITQIRDTARHLQSLTDQLGASGADLFQRTP